MSVSDHIYLILSGKTEHKLLGSLSNAFSNTKPEPTKQEVECPKVSHLPDYSNPYRPYIKD